MDLDAIEKRANAASPGPWNFASYDHRECETLCVQFEDMDEPTPVLEGVDIGDNELYANWDFIAHARTDVPALIARVRELEEARCSFADASDRYIAEFVTPLHDAARAVILAWESGDSTGTATAIQRLKEAVG